MSVGRICVREVDVAEATLTARAAAQRMHSRKVGTLVVVNEAREPVGLVTDRDLTVRVLAEGRDPLQTRLADVMTRAPRSVREETPIEEAVRLMRAGSFRRLIVVDGAGRLAGLVSLDDVLSLLAEEFREIGSLLDHETPRSLARE